MTLTPPSNTQDALKQVQLDQAHSATAESLFALLNSSEQGLTSVEATARRETWGANQLPVKAPIPVWRRWLRQFHNLFIYVLLISALISLVLGHWVDAGVIAAVMIINASIGFIQEGKAEAALRAIRSLSVSHSLAMRDGVNLTIDSSQLVPGDVVLLEAGDRVPADMRLFVCKNLHCDEALLTGESHPASKTILPLAADKPLAERSNMAFMGSIVTFGSAQGLVTHTGTRTQVGTINQLVQQVTLVETPLQTQLAQLARQLTLVILVVTSFTFAVGLLARNYSLAAMFQGAIGIAVAAIPEGLPAIVTIALALGVERMAHKHALVRRLAAVEVLGSVDVICTDKTGTLTANAMTARQLVTTNKRYSITGEGYSPAGEIHPETPNDIKTTGDTETPNKEVDHLVDKACYIALLSSQANLTQNKAEWILHGDPTEGALLVLALKHGLVTADVLRAFPRIDTLPFETEKRYMASLHKTHADKRETALFGHEMAIKGAPDRLLSLCQQQLGTQGAEPINHSYWQDQLHRMARQGMRVMALAYKPIAPEQYELTHADMQAGLVMVALVGISDPPRAEALEAIATCHQAGIRVLMITGDNPMTAAAIGRELGLNSDKVMTGAELDALNPEAFSTVAETVDIFARTSPANKLQLVKALQAQQHTVAMTGDGVNDAPALRRADIGVAMGLKGTDAAREASAFVLTDDNFATIARAVSEGRTIYDNIRKAVAFILPTDLAEASIIVVAILFGWLLPITPVQILWINTITAITLTLALVFETGEANIMRRPPRPRQQGLVSLNLLYRILLVGGLGAATVFGLFSWKLQQPGVSIETARAVAVNALIIFECFYLLGARSLYDSIWHARYWQGITPVLLAIALSILLQLGFTYLPASQALFGVTSLSLSDWLVMTVISCPILLLIELEKRISHLRQKPRTAGQE